LAVQFCWFPWVTILFAGPCCRRACPVPFHSSVLCRSWRHFSGWFVTFWTRRARCCYKHQRPGSPAFSSRFLPGRVRTDALPLRFSAPLTRTPRCIVGYSPFALRFAAVSCSHELPPRCWLAAAPPVTDTGSYARTTGTLVRFCSGLLRPGDGSLQRRHCVLWFCRTLDVGFAPTAGSRVCNAILRVCVLDASFPTLPRHCSTLAGLTPGTGSAFPFVERVWLVLRSAARGVKAFVSWFGLRRSFSSACCHRFRYSGWFAAASLATLRFFICNMAAPLLFCSLPSAGCAFCAQRRAVAYGGVTAANVLAGTTHAFLYRALPSEPFM